MDNRTTFQTVPIEHGHKIYLKNDTGTAELTNWDVFPGITLSYLDANLDHFSCYFRPKPNVFAVNHCEEGRIECQFCNGEYLYMGKGDMAIGKRSSREYRHTAVFPLSHYQGVSLLIDTSQAQPAICQVLNDDSMNLELLCNRFCVNCDFGMIMEETDNMKHLFYELYHVPESIRHRYYKIKVLEILLFLSTFKNDVPPRMGLTKQQVDIVKAVGKELTENCSCHMTIEMLAEKYSISQTALKKSFKNVYGTTIYQYQKEVRITRAKQLLLTTVDSILQIANTVGYENSSKFTVAFKKAEGILPKDYRQSIRLKRQCQS